MVLYPEIVLRVWGSMIDTHAHITNHTLYDSVNQYLFDAEKAGIKKIFNIATDAETLSRGLELKSRWPMIENIAATTPHDAKKEDLFFFSVEKALKANQLIAVGETGLDYHYYRDTQEEQKHCLHRYIQLAILYNKPLVIHCREAFSDLFKILDAYPDCKKVIIHCFTGNLEEAENCLSRGFFLSFSGIVTFKKSVELQKICAEIPMDQLLIETDSPYLAPQSKRGQVNRPAWIEEVYAFIAHLKGVSLDRLVSQIEKNVGTIF